MSQLFKKRNHFFLLLILILLYPVISKSSQTKIHQPLAIVTFDHLNKHDGLSHNYITCIFQDSKGFMWFGTKDGLNKFDGYKFTVFKYDKTDSNSLGNNWVTTIFEDRSGILWIGTREKDPYGSTDGTLNRLDPETLTFTHFKHDPENPASISNNLILSISEDKFGYFWIGTNHGLNKFDRKKQQFENFFISGVNNPKNLYTRISAIVESQYVGKNKLLIGTYDQGLFIFDRNKRQFIKFPADKNQIFKNIGYSITALNEDHHGILWIGRSMGVFIYDQINRSYASYLDESIKNKKLESYNISSICIDKLGTAWLGTSSDGILLYFRESQKFVQLKKNNSNPYGIRSDKITSIFEDNSGTIWIGTDTEGIHKYTDLGNNFLQYTQNDQNPNSLSNKNIRVISEDKDGYIWIGTYNGLNKFDRKNNKFVRYLPDKNNMYSISHKRIWTIFPDRRNSDILWIGTTGGGLNKYNKQNGRFTHYKRIPKNPNSLCGNYIQTIFQDSKGYLWIGTTMGLNRFDPESDKFVQFKHDSSDSFSLSHNRVVAIHELKNNNKYDLWIGTDRKGLNKFDFENNQFIHYKHDPEDPYSLSSDRIHFLSDDIHGNLWVGTRIGLNKFNFKTNNFKRYRFDKKNDIDDIIKKPFIDHLDRMWIGSAIGLHRYDQQSDSFIYYGEKYGLLNKRVDAILEDNNYNLWIQYEDYIAKFNPENQLSSIYELKNSLKSLPGFKNNFLKCSDGDMIFSGLNGFVLINPDRMIHNSHIPPVVITDFRVFHQSIKIYNHHQANENQRVILTKDISVTKEVELKYDENVISLEFAALDYRSPSKNKYAYKMEGIDNDWVYTDASRRFANYVQIRPGEYTFRVKGSNNDGVWNEEGTSLKITILPAWWQTLWFRIVAGLLFVGAIFVLYRSRIQRLNKIAEAQKDFSKRLIDSQEAERQRIASALHDSHGQNLLIINNEIQQFVKDNKGTKKQLAQAAKTVKDSISEIREISYGLHPHQLDRLGLKKAIEAMINKIKTSSNIRFDYSIYEIDKLFDKTSEINIYRILQEALNNIVKHSQATEAKIEIKKVFKYIYININDNGIGYDYKTINKEKKGLGLISMMERVKYLNGKINIISHLRKGTNIKIKLAIPNFSSGNKN